MVSAMAQESDPDPVPASTTTEPGASSSLKMMAELSIANKICVFLDKVYVMSVDLGLRAVMFLSALLKASTLLAQGLLTKLRCRYAPPSAVCSLLPAMSCNNLGVSCVSKMIAYELSWIFSS